MPVESRVAVFKSKHAEHVTSLCVNDRVGSIIRQNATFDFGGYAGVKMDLKRWRTDVKACPGYLPPPAATVCWVVVQSTDVLALLGTFWTSPLDLLGVVEVVMTSISQT